MTFALSTIIIHSCFVKINLWFFSKTPIIHWSSSSSSSAVLIDQTWNEMKRKRWPNCWSDWLWWRLSHQDIQSGTTKLSEEWVCVKRKRERERKDRTKTLTPSVTNRVHWSHWHLICTRMKFDGILIATTHTHIHIKRVPIVLDGPNAFQMGKNLLRWCQSHSLVLVYVSQSKWMYVCEYGYISAYVSEHVRKCTSHSNSIITQLGFLTVAFFLPFSLIHCLSYTDCCCCCCNSLALFDDCSICLCVYVCATADTKCNSQCEANWIILSKMCRDGRPLCCYRIVHNGTIHHKWH